MDLHSKLVALLLGICSGVAHAGYAQMTPPTGWSPAAQGERGFYRAAANEAWVGNTVRTSGALNVGGRAVAMPAAMRMSANAPLFAARALAGLGGPLALGMTFAAAIAIPAMQAWMNNAGVSSPDGNIWFGTSDIYFANGAPSCQGTNAPAIAKCGVALVNGRPESDFGACTVIGVTATNMLFNCLFLPNNNGITQSIQKLPNAETVEIPKEEAAQRLAAKPMPSTLPNVLPMPWPVDDPVINPSPALQPQPMRVPQGNPQPVPDTNPQQYRQPMTRVTPSPSPASPWQVDLTPEDVVSTDPDGIKDPTTVDEGAPNGEPKQPDLCEKNPDILACQKVTLGSLAPVVVPNENKTLAITKDEGWGPSSSACPAPRTAQVLGMTLSMPFTMLCQFAQAIRPLFIAFAWLSAALTFFGIGRRD